MSKNEKPIIFSADMIKAIQNTKPGVWPAEPIDPCLGFKSKTRRVIKTEFKPLSTSEVLVAEYGWLKRYHRGVLMIWESEKICKTPYKEGDILWVKEAFCKYVPEHIIDGKKFVYKADSSPFSEEFRKTYIAHNYPYKWKSPWYMPRVASRYLLEVKSVKVERIKDITYEDCIAEGIYCYPSYPGDERLYPVGFIKCYRDLWNKLNEKRGFGFALNPWVYVYEFMRVK